MQITVIPNLCSQEASKLLTPVCQVLQKAGASVVIASKETSLPASAEIQEALKNSQAAVAIGGDGTIMHVAKAAASLRCPVLGINGGHLGFLAGVEKDELDVLPRMLLGDAVVEKRAMLEVTVEQAAESQTYLAMNEAVISRGALSKLVDTSVLCDGQEILHCRGDGVIVATSTGSTAYSLSAGGPVVDPAVDCMLVTPVCPHTVVPRSHILPASQQLTIEAGAVGGGSVFVTVDGEENVAFSANDRILIRRAKECARLLRLKSGTFYDVLRQKMLSRRSL